MKKLYYSLTALLFVAAGCSNNDFMDNEGTPAPVAKSQTITSINATIDNADTRTYLEGGHQVAWEDNDLITVFSDETRAASPFSISTITSPTSATFVGLAVTGSEFYAVYPNPLFSFNIDEHTITIPWDYAIIYSQVNYGRHIPMFAKGSNSNMQFKQLGGLLHFQLKGQENTRLEYVELCGNNGEMFYNSYDLNYAADDIVLNPNVEFGGNMNLGYDILPHEDGMSQYLSETEPFDIWFSLPAGMTFENGFTLKVGVAVENHETQEETFMEVPIVSDKAFTVTRAAVRNFPGVNVNEVPNNQWTFTGAANMEGAYNSCEMDVMGNMVSYSIRFLTFPWGDGSVIPDSFQEVMIKFESDTPTFPTDATIDDFYLDIYSQSYYWGGVYTKVDESAVLTIHKNEDGAYEITVNNMKMYRATSEEDWTPDTSLNPIISNFSFVGNLEFVPTDN